MIYAAHELARLPPTKYDVCIVGAGPAGVSLAQGLLNSGLRACLVEAGGRTRTQTPTAALDVESIGIQIRGDSRERGLGGTSSTWTGISSPLDEDDFEVRPWVPWSGWPIPRSALVPYYQAASERFHLPPWEQLTDSSRLFDAGVSRPRWETFKEKAFLAAEPPQHFGQDFPQALDSPALDVLLGAHVTNLEGTVDGHCLGVRLALDDGESRTVTARVTVLACGGIENPRLLLNSRYSCPHGLGNDRDQVGRRFMNHPKADHGVIELRRPLALGSSYFGVVRPLRGFTGYLGLRLAPSLQRRYEVLNPYVRFEPVLDWTDNPGVVALHRLIKGGGARAEGTGIRDVADIVRSRRAVFQMVRSRLLGGRRRQVTSIRLRNFLEMAPDPENRLTLSDRVDEHGMRLPIVRHRCGELDRRSIARLHEHLASEVVRLGWGRLRSDLVAALDPWPIDMDASHHMGATRMGTDPVTSVVDENCRIHATPNVYVAGSSVFPTSGCANPTYTIVALALRLADHLKARLASGPSTHQERPA